MSLTFPREDGVLELVWRQKAEVRMAAGQGDPGACPGPRLRMKRLSAPNRHCFPTRVRWGLLTTILILLPTAGAALADEAEEERSAPETAQGEEAAAAVATPATPARSERDAIIERLRCGDVDPTECFIPEPVFAEGDLAPAYVDPDGNPVGFNENTIDTLLKQVGQGFAEAEEQRVVEAASELSERRYSELQFFGVTDHHVDPPYDYYRDPVKSITRVPMLHLDEVDPRDFDIPLVVNDRVQDWMVYFLTRGRKHFTKWIGRKQRYEPFIVEQLEERGMPRDLLYQSMIESGFSPYAYSWAKAAGIWQFIPSTGRRYGMTIDWWVDQRRDPYVATAAALDYLEYLYGLFGDWHLASAAYNAGEGKIGKAIEKYGTRNFWELCQGDYLKPETKDYVPKIIAAAILSKYAERYGLLADVPEWYDEWEFELVTVPEATDVGVIAEITGATEEEILEMNPSLRRWCTPPDTDDFSVRIPVGQADTFHAKLEQIPEEQRLTFKRYQVQRGDTLSKIAAYYGVSVDAIVKMNNIRNVNSISVGTYYVIPVRPDKAGTKDVIHTVEKGESLGALANRYGVTVGQIKEWNELDGDVIQPGQALKMSLGATSGGGVTTETVKADTAVAEKDEAEKDEAKKVEAQEDEGDAVAEGENENEIEDEDENENVAEGEGEPENDSSNETKGDAIAATESAVEPKQEPVKKVAAAMIEKPKIAPPPPPPPLPAPKGDKLVHEVRKGESLSVLAMQYDVTTKKIQRWNRLRGDTIYVGQTLTIHPGPESKVKKLTHTVASGDTLWEIAHDNGVSVADLKKWNELGRDTIRIGQELTVYTGLSGTDPTPRSRTVTHKVQSGETLWDIARRYNVSVDAIKKWNGLRRDTVYIGQSLTLQL